jgi:hypothetical protein
MSCIYGSHLDSGTGRGLLIPVPEWFRHRNFFFSFSVPDLLDADQSGIVALKNLVTVQYSVAQKLQRSLQVTLQPIRVQRSPEGT